VPRLLAIAPPGLEPAVARELAALGHPSGVVNPGHVAIKVHDLPAVATLCHQARTPARLLLPVVKGPAPTLDELARLVRSGDWSRFLDRKDSVEVSVTKSQARIRRQDAVEKKVINAISDAMRSTRPRRLRRRPVTQHLRVRLEGKQATISIDVGGGLLHKRGWRKATGRAPLRETLAASLLVLAGWTPDEPLLDPFCGAGTFPIEAALMASQRSPFVGRTLACNYWPALADWRSPNAQTVPIRVPIIGSDHSAEALVRSRDNAHRAGVSVQWIAADVARIQAPSDPGLAVCNPPYGKRLGNDSGSVQGVFKALGRALRGPLAGWRALFLCPNARLAGQVDRDAFQITTFPNGGLRVGVWAVEPE